MKKETLEALKKSIAKWKRIVRSPKALDEAESNCALCLIFREEFQCGGCPVCERTGHSECQYTPFSLWYKHFEGEGHDFAWNEHNHRVPRCKTCLHLAKEELAFLESLLPKGKKK